MFTNTERIISTVALVLSFLICNVHAFSIPKNYNGAVSKTCLAAAAADKSSIALGRRAIFRPIATISLGTIAFVTKGQEANASYSAYTNREKDWQERQQKGGTLYYIALIE